MSEEKRYKYDIELLQSIIESLARFLASEIRKYYAKQQEKQDCNENLKESE